MLLILKQPDFGMTLVFIPVILAMLLMVAMQVALRRRARHVRIAAPTPKSTVDDAPPMLPVTEVVTARSDNGPPTASGHGSGLRYASNSEGEGDSVDGLCRHGDWLWWEERPTL